MQHGGYRMCPTLAFSPADPKPYFPVPIWCFSVPLKMSAAAICIPKDDPTHPLGDDAHFIHAESGTVGVADGVGGWRRHGVDSGEYARQLMHNSFLAVQSGGGGGGPKTVLEEAYRRTTVSGSSTACVVDLSPDGVLRAANIGDSGFVVVRGGRVVYRSPVGRRSFNCPYQLGITKDGPEVAEEIEVKGVERGDVVVVGTDGLFDNVHAREIAEVVGQVGPMGLNDDVDLAEKCCYLANMALYNSFDRYNGETPFAEEARRAGKERRGGKVDDITVVIARKKKKTKMAPTMKMNLDRLLRKTLKAQNLPSPTAAESKLTLRAASHYIPKENPSKPLGEDSHFISADPPVIGVADGVGGWSAHGVDAGEYARELMAHAARAVGPGPIVGPKDVLLEAHSKTKSRGSSTACVAALDHRNSILRAANLGDSGFVVVRGGQIAYRSPVQVHGFNWPYQMGEGTSGPQRADELAVGVKGGDVVVMGTDGLFDNVFKEDIAAVVAACLRNGEGPEAAARMLAEVARQKSLDRNLLSPFEVAAYAAGVKRFGGKYDDVTVVVAYMAPTVKMKLIRLLRKIQKALNLPPPTAAESKLTWRAASHYIPKESPSKPLGEDSHFISADPPVIGVADGFGNWSAHGVDAGKYARELMAHAARAVGRGPICPKNVLLKANSKTKSRGSSTACVAAFDQRKSILRAANVGNSGFMLLRGGDIRCMSAFQVHEFNVPYQMGEGTSGPQLAYERSVARRQSLDSKFFTPFELDAFVAGFHDHRGGKYDDVTVVVAYVGLGKS
ncbi:protein phosphatase 2C family protein [Striga asiatica]|uniref:Protein phosphatase 2C family protein n=1 Tax=Striga asiatica TaxID=4170 RepID=A0A5A7NZ54_STRAF|nr:protein phosphatase 2C family protein [Striga asiatica]